MVGNRPLPVSAAAAMTIAMGLFFAFTAVAGSIGIAFGDSVEPATQGAVEAGEGSALRWLSEHGVLWMGSYAAIAIAAVSCGVGVWLRRRWARRGSQVVMSLCAALFLVAGAVLGISLRNSFGDLGSFGQVVFGFWGAYRDVVTVGDEGSGRIRDKTIIMDMHTTIDAGWAAPSNRLAVE